jgi:hypothetical protein
MKSLRSLSSLGNTLARLRRRIRQGPYLVVALVAILINMELGLWDLEIGRGIRTRIRMSNHYPVRIVQ